MTRADFRRQINQLKASISLKELVERDGHKLVRNGSLWKCCCPFHRERTPSCFIYPDGHMFCYGCYTNADIFGYVMKTQGCDFKTAVERLSNGHVATPNRQFRVVKKVKEEKPPDFDALLLSWSRDMMVPLTNLSKSLGVTFESLVALSVAEQEMGVWAFPMREHDYKIVGIRMRNNHGEKWAVKGSKQGLFLPVFACYECPIRDMYVTEGPTDCAAMLSMGLFAIGKASAMQGPEEIIKFIHKNRIRRVIVIADNDTAGLNGAKKLIDVCPVPCCELVLPAKDAREFYRNGGTRELIENLLKSCVWRTPKHA